MWQEEFGKNMFVIGASDKTMTKRNPAMRGVSMRGFSGLVMI
jgi:hypothetical protein